MRVDVVSVFVQICVGAFWRQFVVFMCVCVVVLSCGVLVCGIAASGSTGREAPRSYAGSRSAGELLVTLMSTTLVVPV